MRDHVGSLKMEADKEHSKMWAAIHGLKVAIKKRPSKFQVISNNKLMVALVPALLTSAVAAYSLSVSASTAAKIQIAEPVVQNNCEALRELANQRFESLDRNLRVVLRDPKKSAAQKDDARDFYIEAIKKLPDVKC